MDVPICCILTLTWYVYGNSYICNISHLIFYHQVFELGLANRWDGFMVGITEIQVLVPIYSEISVLLLTNGSTPDPVLLSIGGMILYSS